VHTHGMQLILEKIVSRILLDRDPVKNKMKKPSATPAKVIIILEYCVCYRVFLLGKDEFKCVFLRVVYVLEKKLAWQ
jgi:hypothetical protein